MGLKYDVSDTDAKNEIKIEIKSAYANINEIRILKNSNKVMITIDTYNSKKSKDATGKPIFTEVEFVALEDFTTDTYDTNKNIDDALLTKAYTHIKTKSKFLNSIDIIE